MLRLLSLFLLALLLLGGCSNHDQPAAQGEPAGGKGAPARDGAARTTPDDSGTDPARPVPERPATRSDSDFRGAVDVVTRSEAAHDGAQVTAHYRSAPLHPAPPLSDPPHRWGLPEDRENYRHVDDNPVKLTRESPVSTFSIDVDTAAYSNMRRLLTRGALPPADAVRIEELVNYFSYDYPPPAGDEAFRVVTEVGPAPWANERRLLHIGIQGRTISAEDLPPANLVFLIDVSGSMQSPDKLDLLKASMKLLLAELDGEDRVSIAVYAGSAGAVLEPTPGDRTAIIEAAIDRLTAGGSTNGGAGIQLAYALARQGFVEGGINRVILATDGDFNVGTTSEHALTDLVSRQRESGVALTVLGFGTGNYNDSLMQRLAQSGNGNAAYVDTLNEARKVLVDELASTLAIIAKDVKIQVEFNPGVVSEYRLLGYETRILRREDFNDDRVDAGEIGAGHTVTALYEISLVGAPGQRVDPLRYGDRTAPEAAHAGELALVRLRHKQPDGQQSSLIEQPVLLADAHGELAATSDDFRFSAAVAGFGGLLRGGAQMGEFAYDDVLTLAGEARGADRFGYRSEFLGLVRTAEALGGRQIGQR